MRRTALALALAAALRATAARAQEDGALAPSTAPVDAAPSLSGPVVSVVIDAPFRGEDPWARTGLARYAPFSAALARDALRHALASGTFAEARVSARAVEGGVEVIVRGERRYHLVDVEVAGSAARDPELLREDAALRAGTYITATEITEALQRVEEAYHDLGYPDARARADWSEADEGGGYALTLRVTEGRSRRVRAVVLAGLPDDVVGAVRHATLVEYDDIASAQRVRAGRDSLVTALRREGYLDARVEYLVEPLDDGAVLLRYQAEPGARYMIEWAGARAMPEAALVEALRLGEERGFTDGSLASFCSRVQDFYARRAWPDAHARASLGGGDARRRSVRIAVSEGRQVFVRSLSFPGATVLSHDELRDMVEEVARAELPAEPTPRSGAVWRERTYTPGVYATAAERMVQAYRERGYLDARVDAPVVARVETPAGSRLDVTMRVSEGPRSFVEELVFDGNVTEASASLAATWALPLGVPVSQREIGEARVRLTDWYRERGHAFARVEPEVERSTDHTRARLRVVVHEGPRVRIGRVEVRGNAVTLEGIVRARLALREGDVFSLSALRTSQRQLYDLGVFSGVNVGLEGDDVEAPVKTLLVRVVEERRVSLELRGGFSLGQGGRAGFEIGVLNLGGRAVNLSVRGEVGYLLPLPIVAPTPPPGVPIEDWGLDRVTGLLPVSFAFPYLPLLGPQFRVSADAVFSSALQPWSYRLTTVGVGGTLTWRPVQRLAVSLTLEFQRVFVELFGASTVEGSVNRIYDDCVQSGQPVSTCENLRFQRRQNLLRYEPGASYLLPIRAGVVYDGRDNPLTPRRGMYASSTVELLNLLSFSQDNGATSLPPAARTLHIEGRVTGFIPLPARMVLMLSARGGWNYRLSDSGNTHPSRLFWLGGASSMRAWTQNQLLPREILTDPTRPQVALGGDLSINGVADLRIPLPTCEGGNFCPELGLFLDVGNVWLQPESFTFGEVFSQLRLAPGVGLRLATPVGILALDLGFVVNPALSRGESTIQTVQFSLLNGL